MELNHISIFKKDILAQAKKLRPERKNVSFRMREDIYEEFQSYCHENDVSTANVLELLIEKLLKSKK